MYRIRVSIPRQELELLDDRGAVATYAVSTAANGPGQREGSECTPLGLHRIRAKIGDDCPPNSVFVGRRPTGELYSPELREAYPGRDWILTRILWLTGCESGFNRGGNVDTLRRYIYIHGTPDEVALGKPESRGCIRMRNQDIVELFARVAVGTPVSIE